MSERVLEGVQPQNVFRFFEEIAGIPHGSYHIDEISSHLVKFAKEHNLSYVQDEQKNVIIYKPATKGYENESTVILQGHMDMVAVHNDPAVDMNTTPLKLCVEGDTLYAKDSSLGGDDGIAVAYAMAILDDDSLEHPALEVLITTNEEVGMDGALGLDPSHLKGKRMINIDSEDEGIFTVGCAGGVRVTASLPLERRAQDTEDWVGESLSVEGLLGGHSGVQIHLGRANAIKVLARALYEVQKDVELRIDKITGGTKCNAIPNVAKASFYIRKEKQQLLREKILKIEQILKHEYHKKDDNLSLCLEMACAASKATAAPMETVTSYTKEETKRLLSFLLLAQDGVQSMSATVDGLVETSLNLGVLEDDGKEVKASFELRSMIRTAADDLRDKVAALGECFGAEVTISASYPEWEYREESPLRDKMVAVYREMYHKEPVVDVIHAGLECGAFAVKIDGFDGVSMGPDMRDIHTTKETLSISSAKRVYEYLIEVLRTKDE